jgi:hypothetical protein
MPKPKVNLPVNAVVISFALDADGKPEVRIASDLPIAPYVIDWGAGKGNHAYVKTGYGVAGITTPIPDKVHELNDADAQAVTGFHVNEAVYKKLYGDTGSQEGL